MTMTRKLRVGLLGGGGILDAHAPGFALARDLAVVTAVAEPVAAKADRLRALFGADIRIYADYRDLLAQADVDAVDVVLPHHLHLPATLAAAAAGKHVLVEKVMARNIWECDRMIEACDQAGVTLTICHDRRYDAEWMALKTVIDAGLLGDVLYWKLDHNQDVAPREFGIAWASEWNSLGGGAIMSCLTHQIDALRHFGGEVESVTCMTKIVPERMEGETFGVIAARMRSGALANLSINWMTRSDRAGQGLWYEMVHACGTRGEAYYMSGRGTFVLTRDGTDPAARVPCEPPPKAGDFCRVKAGDWSGHQRCIMEWVKLARGERGDVLTSGRDVRGTVEVAEAAYQSVKSGREVRLPIKARPWRARKAGAGEP